jgi:hypothetical protein
VSSRRSTFVDTHALSPEIVIAAIVSVVPMKFGPPESPKHVPPAPTDPFCVRRSQLFVSALKNDVAFQR